MKAIRLTVICAMLGCWSMPLFAQVIDATMVLVGNDQPQVYRYNFTVTNESSTEIIFQFNVNLANGTSVLISPSTSSYQVFSPVSWDSMVGDPNPSAGTQGFVTWSAVPTYDTSGNIVSDPSIPPLGRMSAFGFLSLANAKPFSYTLAFQNINTFDTRELNIPAVPETPPYVLFITGLAVLAGRFKIHKKIIAGPSTDDVSMTR